MKISCTVLLIGWGTVMLSSTMNYLTVYSPVDIVESAVKIWFLGWNLWRQPIGFFVFLFLLASVNDSFLNLQEAEKN